MFCKKCGTKIPEGALFCGECGEKAIVTPQKQVQPIQSGVKPKQQKEKMSKKAKKLILFGGGAVLLLAIAAVLIFVVFTGGGQYPFSGNTVQTKFINDNVKVFQQAFSDFGSDTIDKIKTSPFDIEIEMQTESEEGKDSADVALAYDKQVLGISIEGVGSDTILLLEEDSLYIGSDRFIDEIEFDPEEDLSRPMPLIDRLSALAGGLLDEDVDYTKLIEMLVNSIDEDCFDKSDSKTTLSLKIDDISQALETFADKLEEDDELNDMVEDIIKEAAGMSMSLSEAMNFIIPMLESSHDDFELVWEISYENTTPAAIEISYNGGEETNNNFVAMFGYEKDGGATDIEFSYITFLGKDDMAGELKIEKARDGIEYNGKIKMAENDMSINIEGSEEWSGQEVKGSLEVSYELFGETMTSLIKYEETISFSMPEKSVEDDRRFRIDTKDARTIEVHDLSSFMAGLFGMGSFDIMEDAFEQEPAVEMPEEAEEVIEAVEEEPEEEEEQAAGGNTIGVLTPFTDGYYGELISALESKAAAYGLQLEVLTSGYDLDNEISNAQLMVLSGGKAALIVFPISHLESIEAISNIAGDAGIPVVFMDDFADGSVTAVSRDYFEAGKAAALLCQTDKVYILSAVEGIDFTVALEEGFDSVNTDIIEIAYSEFNTELAMTITEEALADNPDIEIFVCFDPSVIDSVVSVLEAAEFNGKLICIAEETKIKDMSTINGFDVSIIYYPIDDTANSLVDALAGFLMGGTEPKVYVLIPSVG